MENEDLRPVVETRGGELAGLGIERLPRLIQRAGSNARQAMINFFIGQIENDNTRAAYLASGPRTKILRTPLQSSRS